jgi:hypothetical protein
VLGPLRTVLTVIVALAGVAGCAVTQETGVPFPSNARQKLVLDRTTRPEARRLLGPPVTTITDAEGRERWTYEHTQISATRAIPFGRTVTVRQTPYERVVLTFQNNRLTDCTYLTERYRTEGDLIVSTGTTQEPCGVRP